MTRQRHCDVLVLGAGPAGSSLAAQLAAQGFLVLLADRQAFPRDKPCGEFLSPGCLPFLRAAGVEDQLRQDGMVAVGGMTMHGFRHTAHGAFRALGAAGAGDHGFAIRRQVLDHRLWQAAAAAGAEPLVRHRFESLLRAADGRVTGAVLRAEDATRVAVTARWTVGADGVRSPVARAIGVQRPLRWLDRFALTAHFAGVPRLPRAELHVFPRGYFAATTVDQGLFAVNLVVDRRELRQRAVGGWDAFVGRRLQFAPVLAERLAAAARTAPWRGIGPLAHTTTRQHAPGIALCGDACGYVDPMTGEGIYFALWGAHRLARALAAALHDPRRAAGELRHYARDRAAEVAPRALLTKLLQRSLPHALVARTLLWLLASRPWLADLLVTLTGDGAHPRDLLRPSFWRAFTGRSSPTTDADGAAC